MLPDTSKKTLTWSMVVGAAATGAFFLVSVVVVSSAFSVVLLSEEQEKTDKSKKSPQAEVSFGKERNVIVMKERGQQGV
jgi:hypothetical protein